MGKLIFNLKNKKMDLQKTWKEFKSFKKDASVNDLHFLLDSLGYTFITHKSITNKKDEIIKRKIFCISPAKVITYMTLGKTNNIISIISKP